MRKLELGGIFLTILAAALVPVTSGHQSEHRKDLLSSNASSFPPTAITAKFSFPVNDHSAIVIPVAAAALAPAVPVLSSPANGASFAAGTTSVNLVWNPVTGATTYDIQVGTSCGGTSIANWNQSAASSLVPGLSNGNTYFWRVRSVSSGGTSAYSSCRSFSVSSAVPAVPVLSSPADGASFAAGTTSVNLVWNPVTGATTYDIQVGTSCGGTSIANWNQSAASSLVPGLSNGNTYFWRVRSVSSGGTSAYSSCRSFSISSFSTGGPTLLPAPTLSAPANGASNVSTTPTFSWSSVSGATKYWIAVATSSSTLPTDPNASSCPSCVISCNVSTTNHTAPSCSLGFSATLSANTTYFWRVQGYNPNVTPIQQGQYSGIFSFTTAGPTLLPAPTLTSPSNAVSGVSTTPSFNWSTASGANRYWLTVATSSSMLPTDPNATSCPACIISGNSDGLTYSVPNGFSQGGRTATLNSATTYFWRVQGWNTNGAQGIYSNTFSFTTAAVAGATSTVFGLVTDINGVALSGADIRIGNTIGQSNSQGNFSIGNLVAEDYAISVSRTGYATISEPISIPANAQIRRDFRLNPNSTTSSVNLLSVNSSYPGQRFFMDSVSKNVLFTANVDWGGHPPSRVQFVTPKGGTFNAFTSGPTASQSLNMGTQFGPCSKLNVQAFSSDGASSNVRNGDFVVMTKPPLIPGFSAIDLSGAYYYEAQLGTAGALLKIFDELINDADVPAEIPLFGRKGFSLRYVPNITAKVNDRGEAEYGIDFNRKPFLEGTMAGFSYHLEPKLSIQGRFSPSSCKWQWGGYAGGAGGFEKTQVWPFLLPVAGVPVPVYLKLVVKLEGDFIVGVQNIEPVALNGQLNFNPSITGSAGVGVNEFLAVEGSVTGGAEYRLNWPQLPRQDLTIFVAAKISAHAFLFKAETQLLRWDYHTSFDQDKTAASSLFNLSSTPNNVLTVPMKPSLLSRDYLNLNEYGTFVPQTKNEGLEFNTQLDQLTSNTTSLAALQLNVFPHSEANVSVNGNSLSLVWLFDNPNRTSINRSMAVFGTWNGSSWTEPQPINDDGTSDFHPQVLTFSNGSALAVWEDVKAPLSDSAAFEEMVANLEISASKYDSQTKTWTNRQRLTNNNFLDRSPKIAGPSVDNALAVYVSNASNDLNGSTSKPNTLWYSKSTGFSWTNGEVIATVPFAIVKYDLNYNGSKADLILSLDTDNDPSTTQDHELYSLHYENGIWGSLTRLTQDSIADDNPRLSVDSRGTSVLVWLKGEELSSALNLNTTSRRIIKSVGYSSNLADFKLATGPEGRLGVVWTEPGRTSASDLRALFYDPTLDVWGDETQLTADPETEQYVTATFFGNRLMAFYDRTNIQQAQATITELEKVSPTAAAIPEPGTTDLYVLSRAIRGDLAIKLDSFLATPANPRAGETTTLTATVLNRGDLAVRDVVVSFYQGSPSAGGVLIGTTTIPTILSPGSETAVSMPWTHGPATSPFTLFVVVDPAGSMDELDRANNSASLRIVKADLVIQSVRWEKLSGNLVGVTARVANIGNIPTTPTTISFSRDNSTGLLLASAQIGTLNVDQAIEITMQWNTSGLTGREYPVYLLADSSNSVDEYDKTNNNASIVVTINPDAPDVELLLDQSNPTPDQVVGLDSVLLVRDPLQVVNPQNLLNKGSDKNTRVILFVKNLQLAQGEPISSIVITLIDSSNNTYDIVAEDLRSLPNLPFSQLTFRLPNNLPAGTCIITVKGHGQFSNVGSIRIKI